MRGRKNRIRQRGNKELGRKFERRGGQGRLWSLGSQKESNSVCIDSFGGARAIPVFRGSDILDAFIIDFLFRPTEIGLVVSGGSPITHLLGSGHG